MLRLTCRALRAMSLTPVLWLSSSSSVVIGRNTSCSSNRKIDIGSCKRTFVSSTKTRGLSAVLAARPFLRRLAPASASLGTESSSLAAFPGNFRAGAAGLGLFAGFSCFRAFASGVLVAGLEPSFAVLALTAAGAFAFTGLAAFLRSSGLTRAPYSRRARISPSTLGAEGSGIGLTEQTNF